MKNIDFPIFKTKSSAGSPVFDLSDPEERKKYFEFKAGSEIRKIREYLNDGNTFLVYLLGKKNAGKGVFVNMVKEALDTEKIVHISVGDLVRNLDEEVHDEQKRKELVEYLQKNYRGYIDLDSVMKAQLERSQTRLLPTEFILAMIKREVLNSGRKAIFLDGFPRNLDQVSYSLFFRDLIGFREDPDFMVLLDVPQSVIDERIKYRVVCPICHTPRNKKLHITKNIGYDKTKKEYYLTCDNPGCKGSRMVAKEGDELGIEAIRDRLEADEVMMVKAFNLYGIPKILLNNSVPIDKVNEYVDDYELTPEYVYNWNEKKSKVDVSAEQYIVVDDMGRKAVSFLPTVTVISFIKQLADLL